LVFCVYPLAPNNILVQQCNLVSDTKCNNYDSQIKIREKRDQEHKDLY